MHRLPAFVAVATVLVAGALPAAAHAQARPGNVSGTVRGEQGRPLDNAIVVIDPSDYAQRVTTDANGKFRLSKVSRGAHVLRVVHVGYRASEQTIDVPDAGLEIDVFMESIAITELDTVAIRATRTGIFGTVVSHTDLHPLQGAVVDVVGARASAKTNDKGAFNFPGVKEGAYVVNVQRKGYQTRMLSVFIPHDGAVEISPALDTADNAGGRNEMAAALADFDSRSRRRGSRSAVVPRQEFAGHYGMILEDALRYTTSFLKSNLIVVDSITCIFVNGAPKPGMTVNELSAGEVEAVEVYGLGQDYTNTLLERWPQGLPCGNGSVPLPSSSRKTGLQPSLHINGGRLGSVPLAESARQPMDNIARAIVVWTKR